MLSVLSRVHGATVARMECFCMVLARFRVLVFYGEGLLWLLGSLTQSLGPSGFQSRVWPWLPPAFVALVLLQSLASGAGSESGALEGRL